MQFNPSWNADVNPYSGGGAYQFDGNGGYDPFAVPSSGFNGQQLVQTGGNPLGGVYGQPGAFGNPVYAGVPGVGGANPNAIGTPQTRLNPTYATVPGGYNPLQYADLSTTNTLAQMLGGNAIQTQLAGAFTGGAPPQNSIDFGGDSPLNAGLLADRYAKYDRATADAMTRAELAMQGPKNTAPDAAFNTQFQALPGGSQSLGTGAKLGSSVNAVAPLTPAAQSVAQNTGTPPPTQSASGGTTTPAPTAPTTSIPGVATTPTPTTPTQTTQDPFNLSQINALLSALGIGGLGNNTNPYGNASNGFGNTAIGNGVGYNFSNYGSPGFSPNWQGQMAPASPGYTGGVGGSGQFANFMAGNGYQQQPGNVWLRPGSMSGFANTMNNFNSSSGRYGQYAGNTYAGYSRPQGSTGYQAIRQY